MKEALASYITSRLGKHPDQLDVVLAKFREQHTKKKEVLLEEGAVCRSCYFIVKAVSNRLLASYLNLSEATLSRLNAKL